MKKNNQGIVLKTILIISIIVLFIVSFLLLFKTKKEVVFKINKEREDIKIGEYKKIDYIIDDGININWISDNENIAKVDSSGMVNGINYGMTIITGKVLVDGEEKVQKIIISVYSGDKNVSLANIESPDGEILMRVNTEFSIPITIVPSNSYITSIKYEVSNNNIIDIDNNNIIANGVGVASLRVIINKTYNKTFVVNVTDKDVSNMMIKKLVSASFDNKKISMKINEKIKLNYSVNPADAYIEKIEWVSTNPDVVSVINGEVLAKKSGSASIILTINDNVKATITVNVLVDASEIKIDYYPKKLLRIGEESSVLAHVLPANATDKTIMYKSSNPNVVSINNGVIRGISAGSSNITLSINNKSVLIKINVLPSKGVINGTGELWGYHSLNEKTPVRADINFFKKLAQSGKGTLSGDTYTLTTSNIRYTYNINEGLLMANNTKIMARFYYPLNVDLASLNMLTFMGGDGENNFSGFFSDAEKDKSLIRSAGTIVFVAEGSRYNASFDQYAANYATNFAKSIFNQKSTAKNSIIGFSTGGTKVMGAASINNYDRVIVFSSYYNWATTAERLKNKEIMFYIPNKDHLYPQAKATLSDMKKSGYTNVTIVSNSTELANMFGNNFLVINPGSLMINSHVTENVIRSSIISYANE